MLQKNRNWTKHKFSESINTKPIDYLNQAITIEEIKENIKSLKTKKATNQTIKCSDKNVVEHFQTLFDSMMRSGYYPNSWDQGLICSIYKSGKKDNSNTYRGIPLLNYLGKLFSTILDKRFQKELQKIIDLSLDNRKETSLKNGTKFTGIFAFLAIKL